MAVPPHLIVLLCDEEVVQCLVDRFVVVVLYGAKVRFDQGQLFHLWTRKCSVATAKFRASLLGGPMGKDYSRHPGLQLNGMKMYLAEEGDGAGVVQSGGKHYEQIIQ